MNKKITYNFILKPEKNKDSRHPIYLRAFQNGKKIELATSVAIPDKDWSVNRQRVKKANKLHERYNTILDAYDKKALKLLVNNFVNDESPISLRQFKDHILS